MSNTAVRHFSLHSMTAALMLSVSGGLCVHPAYAADAARVLSLTHHFDAPRVQRGSDGYARVSVRNCTLLQRPGEPCIPFRTIRVLLPPHTRISAITSHADAAPIVLSGTWKVEPGRMPVPTRRMASGLPYTPPDPAVYHSTSTYPRTTVDLISVQSSEGYAVAVLRVYPVHYLPATGQLAYTPVLTVNVTVEPDAPRALSERPRRARAVRDITTYVDNPAMLEEYAAAVPALHDEQASVCDYLLITRTNLLTAFAPLCAFRAAQGLAVRTATIEHITAMYAGRDTAEKVRTFIRSAYDDWGVRYVLLGGDVSVIPTRGVYARCSGETETAMPSDLYYACLDGSWNGDGDTLWGEPTDGDDGGDVDLLAEVLVGRAPVDSAVEAARFVAKTIAAESAPPPLAACFGAEYLGGTAQGGNALDLLLPAFSNTTGAVQWLDDRPFDSARWFTADALDALNRAPRLVAHYGHADPYTVMRLDVADLPALANTPLFFLYSTGCDAGAFDYYAWPDCIGEELIIRSDYGAFATLVNSREGWFDAQQEWLYSGEYQHAFFDMLLAGGGTTLGAAHQWAKHTLIGNVELSGNMPYRWCYFGLTLLGDPAAAFAPPAPAIERFSIALDDDGVHPVLTWSTSAPLAVLASTNDYYPVEDPDWFTVAAGAVSPWTHSNSSDSLVCFYRLAGAAVTSAYDLAKFTVLIQQSDGVQFRENLVSCPLEFVDADGTPTVSLPFDAVHVARCLTDESGLLHRRDRVQRQRMFGGDVVTASRGAGRWYVDDPAATNWHSACAYLLQINPLHTGAPAPLTFVGRPRTAASRTLGPLPRADGIIPREYWLAYPYAAHTSFDQAGVASILRAQSSPFEQCDTVHSQTPVGGTPLSAACGVEMWWCNHPAATNFIAGHGYVVRIHPLHTGAATNWVVPKP